MQSNLLHMQEVCMTVIRSTITHILIQSHCKYIKQRNPSKYGTFKLIPIRILFQNVSLYIHWQEDQFQILPNSWMTMPGHNITIMLILERSFGNEILKN